MKVADLSTDELKELISKIIEEKFREIFFGFGVRLAIVHLAEHFHLYSSE